jgi:phosphatidylglycerophosphatase A
MTPQKLFVTFLGTGLSPRYPELLSMLTALILGIVVLTTMGPETLFMLTLATAIIGIFEIGKYQEKHPLSDSGQRDAITIDKATGIWLALLVSFTTTLTLNLPYAQILGAVLSLAAFWLFDSWKPSTIGWIHNNVKGGLGRMGSAVLSGFAGGFLAIVVLMGAGKLLP